MTENVLSEHISQVNYETLTFNYNKLKVESNSMQFNNDNRAI